MTTQEFSIEFDILYNNLASNTAPPLNEYEKSVLLTKAQSDIVIELYSGRNNLGLSYESSEEARKYLAHLIVKKDIPLSHTISGVMEHEVTNYNPNSEILFITRECINNTIPVIPVTQDEYTRIKDNPFKGPSKNRAIRVLAENGTSIIACNLPKIPNAQYSYWGISRPTPIILDGIDDPTLTIEGMTTDTPQEGALDASLHRMILDRAVLYAKQAYIGGQLQE